MMVPGMLAVLMLMDGDADQPGISNDLDGVVWHVDASDNGPSQRLYKTRMGPSRLFLLYPIFFRTAQCVADQASAIPPEKEVQIVKESCQ